MTMAQTLVYLLEAFVLLFVAKQVYARVFRRVDLKNELYGRNNHAMAVAVGGYFFGICLALGGALSGPSLGWQADSDWHRPVRPLGNCLDARRWCTLRASALTSLQ